MNMHDDYIAYLAKAITPRYDMSVYTAWADDHMPMESRIFMYMDWFVDNVVFVDSLFRKQNGIAPAPAIMHLRNNKSILAELVKLCFLYDRHNRRGGSDAVLFAKQRIHENHIINKPVHVHENPAFHWHMVISPSRVHAHVIAGGDCLSKIGDIVVVHIHVSSVVKWLYYMDGINLADNKK
jgi:hypothetical protein